MGRPSGDVCQQNPLSRMSPRLTEVDKAHMSQVHRLSHSMSLTSAPGQDGSKTQIPKLGGVLGWTAPEADPEPRDQVEGCLGGDTRKP